MAKFIAVIEEAEDSTWSASILGEHTVLGTGETKEAAIENLREGILSLQEYLKGKGQSLPNRRIEFVELDVAA